MAVADDESVVGLQRIEEVEDEIMLDENGEPVIEISESDAAESVTTPENNDDSGQPASEE